MIIYRTQYGWVGRLNGVKATAFSRESAKAVRAILMGFLEGKF